MTSVRTETRAPGGYIAVLGNPTFRGLWLALLSERLGEAIGSVALPLLVYRITGDAALMSVIFVIQMAPRALLAPVAGVLADRVDRRHLMLAASLGRTVAVALLPVATGVGEIAAIAALLALGTTVVQPAELAAIPTTVPPRHLVTALSVTQVTGGLTRIVGHAIGAAIVGAAGPDPAFAVQAACYVVSLIWLWRLRLPRQVRNASPDASARLLVAVWHEAGAGMRVVWRTAVVRGITAAEALWALLGAALTISLVVYTEESLELGDRAELVFGLLTTTLSAGAVLGALLAGRIERRIGRPLLMALGYLAPLLLLPAGLVPPLPLLFACWFALGFLDAWAVIAMQAYLAESVADALRGRVYAIWSGVVSLALLVSYALIGRLTEELGAPAALALTGGAVGVGGPVLLALSGALAAVRRSLPAGSPESGNDHA